MLNVKLIQGDLSYTKYFRWHSHEYLRIYIDILTYIRLYYTYLVCSYKPVFKLSCIYSILIMI